MDIESNYIKDSSFWLIYEKLGQNEALDFVGFAGSGILNTNKQVIKLAAFLYKMRESELNPTKQEVYGKSFQKNSYNRQMMNNYLADLKQLLQLYLQLLWINSKQSLQQYVLADNYFKMGLLKQFEKEVNKFDVTAQKVGPDDYYYLLKTGQLDDEFNATQSKKRKYDLLEPVINKFTDYYLIETTRMYCELVNRKNLRNQDFDASQMQVFLYYFNEQTKTGIDNPLLTIYNRILAILTNPTDEHKYKQYKQDLSDTIQLFPLQTAREVCLYGQNQCIAQINKNNPDYLQELLDLYNLMLDQNIMYEGSYMTQYTFKNYVTVALRLRAFNQAEQFVEQYRHKLHPAQQFNAYHYNLAAIYFEENNYRKAMQSLLEIQLTDPVYYLDSRSILLKIYFNEGDFEALTSLYNSVRVYLLRLKQLPKKQTDLYRYLFLYTYKLAKLKLRIHYAPFGDVLPEMDKLKAKIYTADIANKSWLIAIANELIPPIAPQS